MAIDNTKGEVKMVRGSGPPILNVEGEQIQIADELFVVNPGAWKPQLPFRADVIGIDLTQRAVILRTPYGQELVHVARKKKHDDTFYWLYRDADNAKAAVVRLCTQHVAEAGKQADDAIDKLSKAKALLAQAESWASAT